MGTDCVELAEEAAAAQSTDVSHAGVNEGGGVEGWGVVVVVAEKGGVVVSVAAWGVGEACGHGV